jgi:hypothetical protein
MAERLVGSNQLLLKNIKMTKPNYTQQELEERLYKLPEVLKDFMFSMETAEMVSEIGRSNGLDFAKTGILAKEIGYIILGVASPRNFTQQLMEELGISMEQARKIAGDVNHKVFYPLREALKKTYQMEINEEIIEKAEPLVRTQTPRPGEGPAAGRPATPPPIMPSSVKPSTGSIPPAPPKTAVSTSPAPTPQKPESNLNLPELRNLNEPQAQEGQARIEKVISIPKPPEAERKSVVPPEMSVSPKIPPINLREAKNYEARGMNQDNAPGNQETGIRNQEIAKTTSSTVTTSPPSYPTKIASAPANEPELSKPQPERQAPFKKGFDPYREPLE